MYSVNCFSFFLFFFNDLFILILCALVFDPHVCLCECVGASGTRVTDS